MEVAVGGALGEEVDVGIVAVLAVIGADDEKAARRIALVDQVMAIGDNLNDLEMLIYAGTGIRMGNAERSLHDIENLHTTTTNDEDGVAVAIEHFVLNDECGAMNNEFINVE